MIITSFVKYFCRIRSYGIICKLSYCRLHRKVPFTMKLDSPEFKSIFTPELKTLAELFKHNGHELRIAGGAVRDLLMNKIPQDIDFATTATPDEMKEMFIKEEIRMINNRGEKHGTITPRINDKENFEVTTLRIDVRTDGRHAEVEFTKDWMLDANRRDLTINSMFLDLEGTIYDYFNGYEDLKNHRVVFVGDPVTRIREDYLRILRYFRFYGCISKYSNKHEEETIKAIRENAEGLANISGERILAELKKILEGNYAGELLQTMIELGIGSYIGFPKHPNLEELNGVWNRCRNSKLQFMTLLVSILKNDEEVMDLNSRLKLAVYDRELGIFIVNNRHKIISENPLQYYQSLLIISTGISKSKDVRDWTIELLKYKDDLKVLREFESWTVPKFPFNGIILRNAGVPGGKTLGQVIKIIKGHWIESNFNLTLEQVHVLIPKILSDLNIEPIKKKK